MPHTTIADQLIATARQLCQSVDTLSFSAPITHIYNPLNYAWKGHESYISTYGHSTKKIVFLGMNPGPWGMAQTGVPFGEIFAVRDWMKISANIDKPLNEHPKRLIEGFKTTRSEVSGKRLWGLFAQRFSTPAQFFQDHFVINYCPLVFMEESSRNFTPDKLPAAEAQQLHKVCDAHLQNCIEILKPEWIIGVGGFAQKRAKESLKGIDIHHGKVLHPSPASPAANRGWGEAATRQLMEQGIWK
ncbi:MAG: uracil-DNA glycosylase family protein [Verrucomicrobiota bacterium]